MLPAQIVLDEALVVQSKILMQRHILGKRILVTKISHYNTDFILAVRRNGEREQTSDGV